MIFLLYKIKYGREARDIYINYKELIEAYCNEKGFYQTDQSKFVMKPCIYNKDLFNLTPYELGNLVLEMVGLDPDRSQSRTSAYFMTNYWHIVNFFDWCVEKNYIPFNPYRELGETLSSDNLLYQLSEQVNIKLIYSDDIPKYINNIEYNKELYELIVRLLYDGVSSNRELASIKLHDICGDRLSVNGRQIALTYDTVAAINKYISTNVFYLAKVGKWLEEQPYITHKEYLFKKPEKYYIPNLEDEKYIKSNANAIGNYLKRIDLTYIDVFRSGMIDKLRKEFSYLSDAEFCSLFTSTGRTDVGVARKIKSIITIFGKTRTNTELDNCFPYILKSKYYQK